MMPSAQVFDFYNDIEQARTVSHPATYSEPLFPVIRRMLMGIMEGRDMSTPLRVLDPFGGEGGIFKLHRYSWPGEGLRIDAVELEREFGLKHPLTTIGDAHDIPWRGDTFDVILTSPTYGNRMADKLLLDGTQRNTYANGLGRDLSENNSGRLQWETGRRGGQAYAEFHAKAWAEALRVLHPGGWFILNMKDHIRDGQRMRVTLWHRLNLERLGFEVVANVRVPLAGNGNGANGDKRIPYETLTLFKAGGAAGLDPSRFVNQETQIEFEFGGEA